MCLSKKVSAIFKEEEEKKRTQCHVRCDLKLLYVLPQQIIRKDFLPATVTASEQGNVCWIALHPWPAGSLTPRSLLRATAAVGMLPAYLPLIFPLFIPAEGFRSVLLFLIWCHVLFWQYMIHPSRSLLPPPPPFPFPFSCFPFLFFPIPSMPQSSGLTCVRVAPPSGRSAPCGAVILVLLPRLYGGACLDLRPQMSKWVCRLYVHLLCHAYIQFGMERNRHLFAKMSFYSILHLRLALIDSNRRTNLQIGDMMTCGHLKALWSLFMVVWA